MLFSSIRGLMETIFRGFQKWVAISMFLFTKNMVSRACAVGLGFFGLNI